MGELTRRPIMAIEAVRAFFAMRRHGRLTPSRSYLDWRAFTAYGDHKAAYESEDLFHYLAWRRQMRHLVRKGRIG